MSYCRAGGESPGVTAQHVAAGQGGPDQGRHHGKSVSPGRLLTKTDKTDMRHSGKSMSPGHLPSLLDLTFAL